MTGNLTTWKNRATASIAHSALTNSKRPECFVRGVYPTHLTKARACYVWDDKGKRYIDFICALGTNLFGYANKEINDAVKAQLDLGNLYSLGSTAEVEFAETIQSTFPYCEQIRVLKSGSEGCTAAIRIARAATGKQIILSDAYHGWHDDFVSLTPPAEGVPKPRPWIMPLDRIGIPGILSNTAAIIVEPVITAFTPERVQELVQLRELCTKNKVLLIFDEVITAIRFPRLSVANHTGVHPDISIFGKALANGLPISVIGGRAKIMSAPYFVSSTFAGDILPMKAAQVVMRMAKDRIQEIWDAGQRFLNQFNAIAPDIVRIDGYPTRGVFVGTPENKAVFMQEAVKAGILFGPSWFWCEPHNEEHNFVMKACETILSRMKQGECKLEGEMPVTPFAQKFRGKSDV